MTAPDSVPDEAVEAGAMIGAQIMPGETIEAGEVHGLLYPRSNTVEWRQADEMVTIREHHVGKFYRLPPMALAAALPALREGFAAEVLAVLDRVDTEADGICPEGVYDEADLAWRLATARRGVTRRVRAVVSAPVQAAEDIRDRHQDGSLCRCETHEEHQESTHPTDTPDGL